MNRKRLLLHGTSLGRLLVTTAAAMLAAGLTAHLAHAEPAAPPVPATIAVPAGNKLFLVGHAVGVQIHTCTATATGYRWSFVGPRANLYGDNGKLLTTHFGGPSWQARDGSTVVGTVVDRAFVDPTAIPWLLLAATSTTAGPDGDRLAGTTYIQRIATTGGLAPATAGCSESTAGTTAEVPYTADYTFWKSKTG